jgi:hypothetical protein
VGSYTIAAAQGTLSAANYTFTFVNGTLTINTAPLTVTASSPSMTIGGTIPPITPLYSGFVNNDTAGTALTGSPSCSTTATSSSAVGSYPTSCTQGTLSAANYALTFFNGTLTIGYRFDGFLQPINDTGHTQTCGSPCTLSIFKAGSTIPVKFVLKDASGNVLVPGANAKMPQWLVPLSIGTTSSPVDETTYTDTPTPGTYFYWDGSAYHFNWKTSSNQAGQIWNIGALLDDGEVVTVNIGLR